MLLGLGLGLAYSFYRVLVWVKRRYVPHIGLTSFQSHSGHWIHIIENPRAIRALHTHSLIRSHITHTDCRLKMWQMFHFVPAVFEVCFQKLNCALQTSSFCHVTTVNQVAFWNTRLVSLHSVHSWVWWKGHIQSNKHKNKCSQVFTN